jgi:hypothetical protein
LDQSRKDFTLIDFDTTCTSIFTAFGTGAGPWDRKGRDEWEGVEASLRPLGDNKVVSNFATHHNVPALQDLFFGVENRNETNF